jgi:hypothetical protein
MSMNFATALHAKDVITNFLLRKINHQDTDSHRIFLFFLRFLCFFVSSWSILLRKSENPWERRRPRLLDSSISFLAKQSRRGRLRSQGQFSQFQGVATRHATRHEGSSEKSHGVQALARRLDSLENGSYKPRLAAIPREP